MAGGALYNIKETLIALTHFPVERSILINGNHGIGKSAIVKQASADQGIPCLDFRLSQNDVGDLKGMPFHVDGRTFFAPPDWFPLKKADRIELKDMLNLTHDIAGGKFGDRGNLFLDEFNRANIEVQQAGMELALDRRLNMHSLPDGWRVIAAINGNDSIYTITSMEPALLSRFFTIDLVPTFEEWISWATNIGNIHPVIVDFLKRYPDLLDPTEESLKEASLESVSKVNDRRAWDFLSQTIRELERVKEEVPEFPYDILNNKDPKSLLFLLKTTSGYVGQTVATKFYSFVETDYQSLNADMILNNFNKDVESKLKESVKENRQTELTAYNEMLLELIKNNNKNLNKVQSTNLYRYLKLLPNELTSSFWSKFNIECKTISEAWYTGNNKKIILDAVLNPAVLKKTTTPKPS